MNWLVDSPLLLCFAITLVAFLEAFAVVGLFVPGAVLLFSLAAIANNSGLAPATLLLSGMIGAFSGDLLSYYTGRTLKDEIGSWQWFKRHQNWLDQGEWFIRRWGWISVIIGRLLGPLRPVIPAVAGTLRMPPKQFVALDFFTVVLWAPFYLLPGYYTGELSQLWQLQPLSDKAILTYSLTAIALGGCAVAIYHHTHPEQLHLRGWLSRHQAERWPISSLLLAFFSAIALFLLVKFEAQTQNAEFLTWSEHWKQQRITPLWVFIHAFSSPRLTALQSLCIVCWLILARAYALSILCVIALAVTTLLGQFSHLVLNGTLASSSFQETLFLAVTIGIIAMLGTQKLHGLKRWPIYLLTNCVLVLCCISHIWVGDLSLTGAGIALFLALLINGILRSIWRGLHIQLPIKTTTPFILLLALTSIAAGLTQLHLN